MSGSLSGVAGYDPTTGTFGPAVDPSATPQAEAIANGDFNLAMPGTSAGPSAAQRALAYLRQKLSADTAQPPLSFTDDSQPQQGPPAQLQGQGPGPVTATAPQAAPQAPPEDQQLPTPPVPPANPPVPPANPPQAPQPPLGQPVVGDPAIDAQAPVNGDIVPSTVALTQAGESSGNPNATNSKSSATGLYGITDGTFGDFVKSPANSAGYTMADKNKPAAQSAAAEWNLRQNQQVISQATGSAPDQDQLLASHMVGGTGASLLITHPDAPIGTLLSADAIANNPRVLQPGMTGQQAIQSIAAYYRGTAGKTSVTLASAAPDAPAVPASLPGVGSSGLQGDDGIQSLLRNFDASKYQSTTGDQMRALAAGLLSGKTFGQGLGAGLQNLGAMKQNDRSEALKAESTNLGALVADSRARQQMALLGLKTQSKPTGKFGQMPDGTPAAQVLDPTTGTLSWQPTGGATPTQVTAANNATQRVQGQLSGTTATSTAMGRDTVKDNNDQADLINAKGTAAVGQIRALENFKQAVDNGASAGSDAVSQFKRELATRAGINLGDTDGSSVQLAGALGKQLQVQGVQGMRGLGLRTQNEFNTFVKQVAGLDQNPDVVKTLVQPLLDGANNDLNVYKAWHSPDVDQGKILRSPQGVANFRSPMDMQYAASQGVVPGQPNQPTVQKTPQGWQSTSGGVRFKINP